MREIADFIARINIPNWLLALSPFVVVVASYRFGLATKRFEQKIKIAERRYDNLYLPFMDWLVHIPLDWAEPSHYKVEFRKKLMSLLLDNAQYMGEDSASELHRFYTAHSNLESLDLDRNANFIDAPRQYSELFNLLTLELLSEAQELSNTLGLPDLAGAIYASFPDNLSIGQYQLKRRPNLKSGPKR
ncbi:hypothetical protein [Schleiferilactobacillus perolens]|jgi:hypothetical protein|uniref:hypothetical protein n=1 Tax=Schleiferilactobacillus perolens TaxID=100468 RepID=UPI002355B269|nr:hypothetical protein [Schleiferilactobacillus perolens]MCI2170649.1 hypothetical protein [Schleiferilactobacillus perolens]